MSTSLRTRRYTLLGPSGFRTMPWKNGGGRTTEIMVRPHGAGLADFAWRISIADVERDGPFSAFPGVDRTLVLLAGKGMRLSGPQGGTDLCAPFDAVTFRGEDTLDCALRDGPTRDFNLMVRRDAVRGVLAVVREATQLFAANDTLACYAAAGPLECVLDDGERVAVRQGELLLMEGAGAACKVRVRPVAAGGAALVCTIGDAAGRPA
ncbi:MAG: HutD family protein [Burkholderiales bacterium]